MKLPKQSSMAVFLLCAGVFTGSVISETNPPGNAHAHLEKAQQRELDRQMALKRTDLDRLTEDVSKGRKESEDLQQNIQATEALVTESGGQLDQLMAQKKRLDHVVNVTALRIAAERLKSEGLRNLSAAQAKSLAAVTRRVEETDLRAKIRSLELRLLSPSQPTSEGDTIEKVSLPKLRTELLALRKQLAKSEMSTSSAERSAQEAMKEASARLALADAAAAKARVQGVDVEELEPIASDGKEPEVRKAQPVR